MQKRRKSLKPRRKKSPNWKLKLPKRRLIWKLKKLRMRREERRKRSKKKQNMSQKF